MNKQTKDMPYKLYCCKLGCTNIIVASDKPIDVYIQIVAENIPCSKCVAPLNYLKDLIKDAKKTETRTR